MNYLLFYAILIGLLIIAPSKSDEDVEEKRRLSLKRIQEEISNGTKRKECHEGQGSLAPPRVDTSLVLRKLRAMMRNETTIKVKPIDAYIILSQDRHQSEYAAPYDKRLKYISGFSGSVGSAIVTNTTAVLWVDGRYHLQADEQLSCEWRLMRESFKSVPNMTEWMKTELRNARVGFDPKIMSATNWDNFERNLRRSSVQLVEIDENLVDLIWEGHERVYDDKPVYIHDIHIAGKNWTEKIEMVREAIDKEGADAMVITALDEIAWLFNIRSRDVPYTPFVRSYVVLSKKEIYLFANKTKLEKYDEASKMNVIDYLNADFGVSSFSVQLRDYNAIWSDLRSLTQQWQKILLPSKMGNNQGVSRKIYTLVPERKRLSRVSPIIEMKAVKNKNERAAMRRACIKDAAALIEFFAYFEDRLNAGDDWDEMAVARVVDEFRLEQINCTGSSYETIAGFGPNGALPHYVPSNSTNLKILRNSTLVLDSGGQYFEGTTDITRTLHFGEPTQEMKDAYTRVLMGSIDFSTFTFPANTPSCVADGLARRALWEVGSDYMSGSGHGIGIFSNVHEEPIGISYGKCDRSFLKEGNFLTIEPGYYSTDKFGVRLENMVEVVSKPWLPLTSSGEKYLGFDMISFIPFERKLIDTRLMTAKQITWLNDYNANVRLLVGEELKKKNKTEAFYWMMSKTEYVEGGADKKKT